MDFLNINIAKMKIINSTYIIYLFTLLFIGNAFSQSGWIGQPIGTRNYVSINFINRNTGFLIGNDGAILKTTNQGSNWELSSSSNFGLPVKNGFVFNENISGVVSGGTASGMIYISSNGGSNWNSGFSSIIPIGSPGFIWLRGLYLVNENTYYVCGSEYGMIGPSFYVDGIIYKTTNTGANWFESYRGSVDFYDIEFTNGDTGYCTWSSVLKTTNGGNFWSYFGEVNAVTFSITHSFNDTLYMSGDSGLTYRSITGGANWSRFSTPANDTLKKIYFVNSKTGYAAGNRGAIIKTTNAGENWTLQNSNTTKKLNSVWFINKDTGFAVGDSGVILKTYSGGVMVNINNYSEITPDKYALNQNYPNPFNPKTIINYQCSMFNYVELKVYDALGNEVAVLVNEMKKAGSYEVEFDGNNFASGIYFYRLTVNGNIIDTKRMILLK